MGVLDIYGFEIFEVSGTRLYKVLLSADFFIILLINEYIEIQFMY